MDVRHCRHKRLSNAKIAKVVDGNVLVSMHISKSLFKTNGDPLD
jgi:hypothetical protein